MLSSNSSYSYLWNYQTGPSWMEAEIWGVSEWAGKLPEGSQISEHWTVQTEELLWGVSGSSGDHEERKQEPPRCSLFISHLRIHIAQNLNISLDFLCINLYYFS